MANMVAITFTFAKVSNCCTNIDAFLLSGITKFKKCNLNKLTLHLQL